MPLPAPNLDDRSFQDIVDEAKRLIPRFCPEWTNHNLSDPGVALIELFAWMSEMVLFRLNQVPERLYVHFLNLVGIEPFPPSVAHADLTFWLSAPLDQPVAVPAGHPGDHRAEHHRGQRRARGGHLHHQLRTGDQPAGAAVAALTSTAADDRITDVWDDLRYPNVTATCFASTPARGRRRVLPRFHPEPGGPGDPADGGRRRRGDRGGPGESRRWSGRCGAASPGSRR